METMVQFLSHLSKSPRGVGVQRDSHLSPRQQMAKTQLIEIGKSVTRSGLLCIKSPPLHLAH